MTGDKWTFLVVRGEDSPVRQFSISTRRMRAVLVAASVAVIAALGIVLSSSIEGMARIEARQLQARNLALQAELDQFDTRMQQLQSTLDQVATNDANFRSIAGLEVIDPEVLEAGVGGPGLGSPEGMPLWTVDTTSAKATFAASYDLSALERRARLLSESLEEATDSVLAHRDLLESTPSILPTEGWLSSRFSQARMHPIHNRPLPHEGIDISAPTGTPIFAAAKGRVLRAGWVVGYGLAVEIDHGFGYSTLYGHASSLIVQAGQEVLRGEMIARVGSTGVSTSSHLHYEVRVDGTPVDPTTFILPDKITN
ncbi:MAG: M23 family metallopeptidase [Gemmatimonadota bacterium]|jgi:murein DD-endopeptidase MepM/ murein hydrolase activator NlpD